MATTKEEAIKDFTELINSSFDRKIDVVSLSTFLKDASECFLQASDSFDHNSITKFFCIRHHLKDRPELLDMFNTMADAVMSVTLFTLRYNDDIIAVQDARNKIEKFEESHYN